VSDRIIAACITVALTILPMPAAGQDSGVREVTMSERSVITVAARLRNFSEIHLPAGDPIRYASCGDPTFWSVEWADHVLTLKPAKKSASTNLSVRTMSGRSYMFRLIEGGPEPADLRVFVADDSNVLGAASRYVPVAEMDAVRAELDLQRVELAQAKAAIEEERRRASDRLTEAQGEFSTRLHFDYGAPKYMAPFHVRAIWHDGQFTYIRSEARELPALYELLDGKPSLVNFEVRPGGTYVVGKVIDRGYLALGRKRWTFERR
jgi:type IV secretory pathway VirB9-like protein